MPLQNLLPTAAFVIRDDWRVTYVKNGVGSAVAAAPDEVVAKQGEVLTDRRRSLVKVIEFAGKQLVLKQPRNKNNSLWIQLTTLWRLGNARSGLNSLLLLQSRGFAASVPVAALERRRAGVVVDSWLIYEYQPGNAVAVDDYPHIVGFINGLHEQGWLHKDPHIDNFLTHDGQVFAIDIELVPNRYGAAGAAYNWRRLTTRSGKTVPIAEYFSFNLDGWAYRAADSWYRLRFRYRESRNSVRSLFKRKRREGSQTLR